jgi:NADH:ubiquinone oxidoreductase subunit H
MTLNELVTWVHGHVASLLSMLGVSNGVADIIFLCMIAMAVFTASALFAMFGGLTERKLIARVHSRIGPYYVGPFGLLQTLADMLKFLKKEIIFPVGSDRKLFVTAPLMMVLPAFLSFIFLPLGTFVLINSQYSLLLVLALLSLSPIAILIGAWASNSKYSSLGGLRAAAMTMAYEVLIAVAVASIILTTHSLSIIDIVQYQHDLGIWLVFIQPLAFLLFLIAAVASVERNPFDITEAESELVSGWKTEYGGVYFSFTLLAEYIKLLATVILITALFFGGWMDWAGELGFLIKIILLVLLMIIERATALRLRIDQLLQDVWTKMIPAAFLNFVATVGVLLMLGGR